MFLTEEISPGLRFDILNNTGWIGFPSLPETYGRGVDIKSRSSVQTEAFKISENKIFMGFRLKSSHGFNIQCLRSELFTHEAHGGESNGFSPTMHKHCGG